MLWLSFQDKATTGKQGLGIKDRPKKIAGCYWEGKKISFHPNVDENPEVPDRTVARNGDRLDDIRTNERKVKLKKLCKQIISQVICCQFFL